MINKNNRKAHVIENHKGGNNNAAFAKARCQPRKKNSQGQACERLPKEPEAKTAGKLQDPEGAERSELVRANMGGVACVGIGTEGQETQPLKHILYDDLYEQYIRKHRGDAELFLQENRERVRFTADEKQAYVYQEYGIWEPVGPDFLEQTGINKVVKKYEDKIRELRPIQANEESRRDPDKTETPTEDEKRVSHIIAAYEKRIVDLNTRGYIDNVLSFVKNKVETESAAWNKVDRDVLPFEDVLVNIRTQQIVEPSPNYLLNYRIPTKYTVGADCPTWHTFLLNIMNGDEEFVRSMQTIFGYVLLGTGREQKFFLLHGRGGSGKGTMVNVLSKILGDTLARELPSDQILQTTSKFGSGSNHSTWLMQLDNRRMVIISETTEERFLNAAMIKLITGGDVIPAREMFRKPGPGIANVAVPFIVTNHPPRLRESDESIWRRAVCIDFPNTYETEDKMIYPYHRLKDPNIMDKLLMEREGIIQWMQEGSRIVLSNYEKNTGTGLYLSPSIIAATKRYKDNQDWISFFLSDHFEIVKDQKERLVTDLIFALYIRWADSEKKHYLTKGNLIEKVRSRIADHTGLNPDCKTGAGSKYRALSNIKLNDTVNLVELFGMERARPWMDCRDPTQEQLQERNPELVFENGIPRKRNKDEIN